MRIQQYRSVIRTTVRQRSTVETLGLRRIGHVVEVQDNPCIRGMLRKVSHLVKIISEDNAS
jgi:large subunit ribosomal protein L30